MPAPLDPAKRDAIAQAIRDGGKTRNEIAREHEVSGATVTKIAKDIEQETGEPAFDRSQTKTGTEARRADLASRRAELAQLLMDDAFHIRGRIRQEQATIVVGPKGFDVAYIPASARDVRDFMTAIGIAIDKVNVLTRDEAEGLAAVDSWLRSLGIGASA